MIWKTLISMKAVDADETTEPPARVLDLTVIGGEAHLDVHDVDERGTVADKPTIHFTVDARSLLRALATAIEDDASSGN